MDIYFTRFNRIPLKGLNQTKMIGATELYLQLGTPYPHFLIHNCPALTKQPLNRQNRSLTIYLIFTKCVKHYTSLTQD